MVEVIAVMDGGEEQETLRRPDIWSFLILIVFISTEMTVRRRGVGYLHRRCGQSVQPYNRRCFQSLTPPTDPDVAWQHWTVQCAQALRSNLSFFLLLTNDSSDALCVGICVCVEFGCLEGGNENL